MLRLKLYRRHLMHKLWGSHNDEISTNIDFVSCCCYSSSLFKWISHFEIISHHVFWVKQSETSNTLQRAICPDVDIMPIFFASQISHVVIVWWGRVQVKPAYWQTIDSDQYINTYKVWSRLRCWRCAAPLETSNTSQN